ncbi:Gfo/Idh/MocA family protein [Metallococcus carri]|uniref:Gfo/Idh/MocA family protein n=1 Tax=Metallococcus carri TaxID=1656884 RepID=UPI002E2C9C43|nr:Gfo/Idh/MocA family oxidoreductase [Metallococcus carri]
MSELRLAAPEVADPMEAPTLRWGILGTGQIADAFATALREGTRQRVAAVGSRTLERAQAFGAKHGAETAYGSYAELVADPSVDVVYVASPHSEHRDHALLAINAGKHVLVEKAFTRNVIEATEVLDAARARGVFCAEAMWARFLPHYDVVRRTVAAGTLGRLGMIVADHGQPLWPDGPARLSDPDLAGGALLDLGVYPMSFAQMLLPEATVERTTGRLTDRGVDEWSVTTLVQDGIPAICQSTMAAQTTNSAVVAGFSARLEIDSWFYTPTTVRLVTPEGEVDRFEAPDQDNGLRYEAAETARCIAAGLTETPVMSHADTLAVMRLMDTVRAELGQRYPGEPA